MRRAQAAVEFLILTGFMVVVFSTFLLVVRERTSSQEEQKIQNELVVVAKIIEQEVLLANKVKAGYVRTFDLPRQLQNEDYTITLVPADNPTEVIIATSEYEYILFLEAGLNASAISPGPNTISKPANDIITITGGSDLSCIPTTTCDSPAFGVNSLDCECLCQGSLPDLCEGTDSCVNLQNDPENCGTCGHHCYSGACSAGACVQICTAYIAGGDTLWGMADGTLWGATSPSTIVQPPLACCDSSSQCALESGCADPGRWDGDVPDKSEVHRWACGAIPRSGGTQYGWYGCSATNDGKNISLVAGVDLCCSRWSDAADGASAGSYGFNETSDGLVAKKRENWASQQKWEAQRLDADPNNYPGPCYDRSNNDCSGAIDMAASACWRIIVNSTCDAEAKDGLSSGQDITAWPFLGDASHTLGYGPNDARYLFNWSKGGVGISLANLPMDIYGGGASIQDYAGYSYSVAGPASVSGRFGNALAFDGNDVVTLSTNPYFTSVAGDQRSAFSSRTWEMWVNVSAGKTGPVDMVGSQFLFEEGGSGNGANWRIVGGKAGTGNRVLVVSAWAGAQYVETRYPIPTNAWTHVASTFENGRLSLYLGGFLVNSSMNPSLSSVNMHTDASALGDLLGSTSVAGTAVTAGASDGFVGQLDEFQTYGIVLAPAQIALHANGRWDTISRAQTSVGEQWKACVIALTTTASVPKCSSAIDIAGTAGCTCTASETLCADGIDNDCDGFVDYDGAGISATGDTDCKVGFTTTLPSYILAPASVAVGQKFSITCSVNAADLACIRANSRANGAGWCGTPVWNGKNVSLSCSSPAASDPGFVISDKRWVYCNVNGPNGGGPNASMPQCYNESNINRGAWVWYCATGATTTATGCKETACSDGKDNDNDTLIDAQDTDCGCGKNSCTIGGTCYADGQVNPASTCQVCNASKSTTAWSTAPNGAICDDGDVCTSDDRCSYGTCAPGGAACTDPTPICIPDGGTYSCEQCSPTDPCPNLYYCTVSSKYVGGVWQYHGATGLRRPVCSVTNTCSGGTAFILQYCGDWTTNYAEAVASCVDDGDESTPASCA